MGDPTGYRRQKDIGRIIRIIRHSCLVFIFLLGVALIVLSRVQPELVSGVRGWAASAAAPLLRAAELPVRAAERTIYSIGRYFYVHSRNKKLRRENEELEVWRRTAERLALENRRLRGLVNATDRRAELVATARVIGSGGGPFVRAVLVDAGSEQGVTDKMAVVDQNGIVGRIVDTGPTASRLLLVTDFASRIPVRTASRDINAILAGQNDRRPRLMFLPINEIVRPGERLLTSGQGGVFPPDYPVGQVVKVEGRIIEVELYANLDRLDFISILNLPDDQNGAPTGLSNVRSERSPEPVSPDAENGPNGTP
ncbi:MAG: rod shape-determining protein MreC [Pseudomonadota bacterium]